MITNIVWFKLFQTRLSVISKTFELEKFKVKTIFNDFIKLLKFCNTPQSKVF